MNSVAFERTIAAYKGVFKEIAADVIRTYLEHANKHPETPLGSPVRYTDGTISREYEDDSLQALHEAMEPHERRTENDTGAHGTQKPCIICGGYGHCPGCSTKTMEEK